MLTSMFMMMMIILSSVFLFMNHPLAMGLALLLQTLFMALTTGLMSPSFWFSYILFLVFLGGMLVLFIYVASLASNELFSFSTNLFFLAISLFGMAVITMLLLTPLNLPFTHLLNESSSLMVMNDMLNMFMFKMYSMTNYLLTLLAVIYLLLALIIVANIVSVQEGPLRPLT